MSFDEKLPGLKYVDEAEENMKRTIEAESITLTVMRESFIKSIREKPEPLQKMLIELYDQSYNVIKSGDDLDVIIRLDKRIKSRFDLSKALLAAGLQPDSREFRAAYDKYGKAFPIEREPLF